MAQLISIQAPPQPAAEPASFALWQLGFQPFFLLAGGFAAVSIGLWVAQFAGWLPPLPVGAAMARA